MEFAQTLLTYTAQFIALAGFGGIALHAIWSQYRRFMTTYCPPVAIYTPESREVEPIAYEYACPLTCEINPEPTVYEYACPLTCEWIAPQPKPQAKVKQPLRQLVSVGAAAIDYAAMTVPQLRKRCSLQGINWRTGGDYGKAMRKNQMIRALG